MTLVLCTTILSRVNFTTPGWLMWHRSSPAHHATAAAVAAELCTLDWTGKCLGNNETMLATAGSVSGQATAAFHPWLRGLWHRH